MIRKPAVSGQFYPSNPKLLQDEIAKLIDKKIPKKKVKGIMVPHAGYIYSGKVAGEVYSQIEIPNRLIILSPNHTGLGVPFSIMNQGEWQLPFGNAKIDEDLANKLMNECDLLEIDAMAHAKEHALEVQLPFIQYLKSPPPSTGGRPKEVPVGDQGEGGFTFVPITLGHISLKDCQQLGEAIAQVIQKEKAEILIVASSDMNHYQDQETTIKKDEWAIREMLKRDPTALYNVVHQKDISMCGIIPTTVMLTATNHLGATHAELIDHKTSGDVSGDYEHVVGYAGVIIL